MIPAIPVALSTGSIHTYGTARAFALAAQAGYDGLELMVDDRWDTRQAGYLRGLSTEHRIAVLSVHSPFAGQVLPGWPKKEVDRIRLALKLAEAAGARTLNVHLPYRTRLATVQLTGRRWRIPVPGAGADHTQFAAWLVDGGLAALQAETPVSVTVENLPLASFLGRQYSAYAMNTWEELARFPRLCLDTTHTGTTGADLLTVYERLAHNVVHVHLSDYDGRYQHRSIGSGYLPLGPFLERLAARGFAGIVVVELEPAGLPMQDERKLLDELRRNLVFCRRHLGQTAGAGGTSPAGTRDEGVSTANPAAVTV